MALSWSQHIDYSFDERSHFCRRCNKRRVWCRKDQRSHNFHLGCHHRYWPLLDTVVEGSNGSRWPSRQRHHNMDTVDICFCRTMEHLTDSGRKMSLLCCDCNLLWAFELLMHIDKLVDMQISFSTESVQLRIRLEAEARSTIASRKSVLACLTMEWRCCFPMDWQWMKGSKRLEVNVIHQQLVWLSMMDSRQSAADAIHRLLGLQSMMERKSAVLLFLMYPHKVAGMCQMEDECRWKESTQLVDPSHSMVADM